MPENPLTGHEPGHGVADEADRWLARVLSGDMSVDDRRAFVAWISLGCGRAEAFLEICSLWQRAGIPVDVDLPAPDSVPGLADSLAKYA